MILSFVKKKKFNFFYLFIQFLIIKKIFPIFFSFFRKKKFFQNFFQKSFFEKLKFFFLKFLIYNPKFDKQLKKIQKKIFLTKLKIMMLIISPKWKKTILEMALKSLNISKLDHQMSKS